MVNPNLRIGGWSYAEVLAESAARFCHCERAVVEIPPEVRRETEELIASGEADEPTRGAAVAMKKQKPRRKAAAKSRSQGQLF